MLRLTVCTVIDRLLLKSYILNFSMSHSFKAAYHRHNNAEQGQSLAFSQLLQIGNYKL